MVAMKLESPLSLTFEDIAGSLAAGFLHVCFPRKFSYSIGLNFN